MGTGTVGDVDDSPCDHAADGKPVDTASAQAPPSIRQSGAPRHAFIAQAPPNCNESQRHHRSTWPVNPCACRQKLTENARQRVDVPQRSCCAEQALIVLPVDPTVHFMKTDHRRNRRAHRLNLRVECLERLQPLHG